MNFSMSCLFSVRNECRENTATALVVLRGLPIADGVESGAAGVIRTLLYSHRTLMGVTRMPLR